MTGHKMLVDGSCSKQVCNVQAEAEGCADNIWGTSLIAGTKTYIERKNINKHMCFLPIMSRSII